MNPLRSIVSAYRSSFAGLPREIWLREDGRQYVVVASGGHGWSEPGDALLAFALPVGGD